MSGSRASTPGWVRKSLRRRSSIRCHIQSRAWRRRRLSNSPVSRICWRKRSTCDQHSGMPWPSRADRTRTGGCQCGEAGCRIDSTPSSVCCAAVACSGARSALLITIRSASSTMPFLSACRSSPAIGSCRSTIRSVIRATAVSDCPTPTVSTRITSKPAASQRSRTSRVQAATPPRQVPAGEGRMKASGVRANCSIRVLSPRMEPPVTRLVGSTASTATRWPRAITCSPRASMKVDLPTPGAPLMPMRSEWPVCGSRASMSACPRPW